MTTDIVHDYDANVFKVGEEVYGYNAAEEYREGKITAISLSCQYKLRFQLQSKQHGYCWIRLAFYKDSDV